MTMAGRPMLILGERQWILQDGENIIGRGEGVAVRVESTAISRHHARIVVSGGRSTIEDLGSKNGTFAADERISAPRLLHDRDVIQLGRRVRLLFRQSGDEVTESELPSTRRLAGAMFRRDGELWTMMFEGRGVRLPQAKGFDDLARLLARPGVEIHCLELADRPLEQAGGERVLDDRARREIRARARDLQAEIEAADAANDLGRAEQAREELDQIMELLSGALGLGGRSRGLGSPAERARSSVTWRIRSAIKRIATVHPRLARHLQNAVRTGTFCAYQPETPVDWML
jgi:hypothetical protein